MTATTKNRNTQSRGGNRRGYLIGANVRAFAGAIAVLNAAGYCVPATTATGRIAVGRFAHGLDNTGGADGAETVEVERGIFRFENSAAGDAIGLADIARDRRQLGMSGSRPVNMRQNASRSHSMC